MNRKEIGPTQCRAYPHATREIWRMSSAGRVLRQNRIVWNVRGTWQNGGSPAATFRAPCPCFALAFPAAGLAVAILACRGPLQDRSEGVGRHAGRSNQKCAAGQQDHMVLLLSSILGG